MVQALWPAPVPAEVGDDRVGGGEAAGEAGEAGQAAAGDGGGFVRQNPTT